MRVDFSSTKRQTDCRTLKIWSIFYSYVPQGLLDYPPPASDGHKASNSSCKACLCCTGRWWNMRGWVKITFSEYAFLELSWLRKKLCINKQSEEMSRNMGMKRGLISSGGSLFHHESRKSASQNVPSWIKGDYGGCMLHGRCKIHTVTPVSFYVNLEGFKWNPCTLTSKTGKSFSTPHG